MIGRVTYLGRVAEGNYQPQVTYPTQPHIPNYPILPFTGSLVSLPYPPTLLWLPRLSEWCWVGEVPWEGINPAIPWIPTSHYLSLFYLGTYHTLPTVGKISLPTLCTYQLIPFLYHTPALLYPTLLCYPIVTGPIWPMTETTQGRNDSGPK